MGCIFRPEALSWEDIDGGRGEMTMEAIRNFISEYCYVAFARNGKKDVADEAKSDATVLTEIGYIKANTDEIKAEQKEQRKTNVEVVTRLTAVEASAKQAHKRLDTFENRERHEHEE